MTNNGIKFRQILDAIHIEHLDWLDKYDFAKLTYRDFVRACHQIDICDPRTIKVKWEIMQDKDILQNANKYNGIVDLYFFYEALGPKYVAEYQARLKKRTQTDIHTKTLTQCDTGGSA